MSTKEVNEAELAKLRQDLGNVTLGQVYERGVRMTEVSSLLGLLNPRRGFVDPAAVELAKRVLGIGSTTPNVSSSVGEGSEIPFIGPDCPACHIPVLRNDTGEYVCNQCHRRIPYKAD